MLQMQHVIYATFVGSMKTKYEDSLFYQINLSAKYFNLLFEQLFKELNLGLCATEHLALSVIADTEDCCQRDLARILLKDRSNTGKLANNLEKKGLIKIELKTKNNKMVKILTVTKEGSEHIEKAKRILEPIVNKIHEEISIETLNSAMETLKDFRNIVEKAVKVNI